MQLCLVNNDPISTLLITPDGEPVFSIETPPLLHDPSPSAPADKLGVPTVINPAPASTRRQRSQTTTIKRIEKYHRSIGQVEKEIGIVEYRGPEIGTYLHLCLQNHALAIAEHIRRGPSTREIEGRVDGGSDGPDEFEDQTCWEFIGPDSRRYKWQLFVHSPVLLIADNTLTPLARYRRAKVGIVSRSRRAFLEILPAGINLIDLIVVTFVGFMKQRVLIEGAVYETSDSSPTPTVLPSRSSSITPTNDRRP